MIIRRRLLAFFILIVLFVAATLILRENSSPFERYVTPPMAGTNHRVSLLIPKGWIVDPNPIPPWQYGSIFLKPPQSPQWLPKWLWFGRFNEPNQYDAMTIRVNPGATLPKEEEDTESVVPVDADLPFHSYIVGNIQPGPGIYAVFYSRSTQEAFDRTKAAIYQSVQIIDD